MPDSCYLCEIGKEGLFVQLDEREVLICSRCVLDCIYSHPRLVLHTTKQRIGVTNVH